MSEITVRNAGERDLFTLHELQIKVLSEDKGMPEEEVVVPFEAFPQHWCVEDDKKQIIGGVTAWMDDYNVKMGRLAVAKDCRGQHIGSDLLKFAVKTLFAQGAKVVTMDAYEDTIKMIEAIGGQVNGEPEDFFGHPVTPMIINKEKFND